MTPAGIDSLFETFLWFAAAVGWIGIFLVAAAGGLQRAKTRKGLIHLLPGDEPRKPKAGESLKAMTWNIAWAYGPGSDGKGYAPKPESHFIQNLETIAGVIRAEKPDLVLLQEVDLHAWRSHSLNQLHALAKEAHFPFAAEGLSWKANYLPFPGLNPKRHFGKIRSGGAVLSRVPLKSNTIQLLPKPASYPALLRMFYLFRYVQTVEIDCGSRTLRLGNVHLEAFDEKNRLEHLRLLSRIPLQLVGGDFNTDVSKSSQSIGSLTLASPADATFCTPAPTQKLDHFAFDSAQLECLSVRALPTGTESDHRPVVAEFRLK